MWRSFDTFPLKSTFSICTYLENEISSLFLKRSVSTLVVVLFQNLIWITNDVKKYSMLIYELEKSGKKYKQSLHTLWETVSLKICGTQHNCSSVYFLFAIAKPCWILTSGSKIFHVSFNLCCPPPPLSTVLSIGHCWLVLTVHCPKKSTNRNENPWKFSFTCKGIYLICNPEFKWKVTFQDAVNKKKSEII